MILIVLSVIEILLQLFLIVFIIQLKQSLQSFIDLKETDLYHRIEDIESWIEKTDPIIKSIDLPKKLGKPKQMPLLKEKKKPVEEPPLQAADFLKNYE